MSNRNENIDNLVIDKDFFDFKQNCKEGLSKESAPTKLSSKILNQVKKELCPSTFSTFFKFFFIQFIVGTLTTLICPQFKLSFIGNLHIYHMLNSSLGEFACMSVCGGFFVGSGAFFCSTFFNKNELQLISQKKILFYFSISFIFLLLFRFIGANLKLTPTLFWILGAVASGIFLFEISRNLKLKLMQQI